MADPEEEPHVCSFIVGTHAAVCLQCDRTARVRDVPLPERGGEAE